jgi:hypothetical protein
MKEGNAKLSCPAPHRSDAQRPGNKWIQVERVSHSAVLFVLFHGVALGLAFGGVVLCERINTQVGTMVFGAAFLLLLWPLLVLAALTGIAFWDSPSVWLRIVGLVANSALYATILWLPVIAVRRRSKRKSREPLHQGKGLIE